MQFIRQYVHRDGSAADQVTHQRTISHLGGDGRYFRIECSSGDETTLVIFTHEEFQAIAAEYDRYKPLATRWMELAGRPASMYRAFSRLMKHFDQRAQLLEKSDATDGD